MKAVQIITAAVLGILVLVSSTNFIIGLHFCMDEVQNVTLFAKADTCEKEQSLPPCPLHTNAPCCDDQTIIHQSDDFKAALSYLDVAPITFYIKPPVVILAEIIPSTYTAPVKYVSYDPPLRSSDLTVEHQVFLI